MAASSSLIECGMARPGDGAGRIEGEAPNDVPPNELPGDWLPGRMNSWLRADPGLNRPVRSSSPSLFPRDLRSSRSLSRLNSQSGTTCRLKSSDTSGTSISCTAPLDDMACRNAGRPGVGGTEALGELTVGELGLEPNSVSVGARMSLRYVTSMTPRYCGMNFSRAGASFSTSS